MNDSELDFVDLCSKLLKRVRKKPDDHKQVKKPGRQNSSQTRGEDKRKENLKKDVIPVERLASSQPVNAGGQERDVSGGILCDSGDPGTSEQTAKDKVLVRMQQFKRDCPRKMVHEDVIQTTHCSGLTQQQSDVPALSSELQPNLQENTDEALALQLQQELDREAATAPIVDLEDGGLFFCQICHKDLSRMTPDGRTQHLNRCLDGIEEAAPTPLPTSAILTCPICGKNFKSQKSRSAHLKRCSSDMGVSAAVLLQALQRQTEESQSSGTSNTLAQISSSKRKGPTKPSLPVKKPKKKHKALDEDMMVALALSSSLLDQENEQQRKEDAEGRILTKENTASHHSVPPLMKRGAATGRGGRGTKKKGTIPRPPPLLLLQDPEAAVVRLQERVSALLLCSRPSSPPTPTRCTSTLPGWSGATPLWQKTALLDEGFTGRSDFYAAELREFFLSSQPVMTDPASLGSSNKPKSSVQLEGEGAPTSAKKPPLQPAASPPGTGQLLVDSQALRDLMELAEDGMTLTQCGYTRRDHHGDTSSSTNLQLSGFVLEEAEEPNELSKSGFVPETAAVSLNTRTTDSVKAEREKIQESVVLCRLAADLSSMVNNPQLSDVQLQVDSGEIFYAHTFMLYARCPLLAEMVHESGIGVKEAGLPATHRILMNDVPGQAVFALLRYLYTSHCSIHASMRPHVLELASRFDLQELQQLCQETKTPMYEEINTNQVEETHTDEAFMELLRSMWMEGNEDEDGMDSGGGTEQEGELQGEDEAENLVSGFHGLPEERVNEEELEEIYEFAATQRKREEQDSEEEEEENGGLLFTKLMEPKVRSSGKAEQVEQNQSLDRSYSRIFSEEGDIDSPMGHISEQHPRRRTLLQSSDNMSPSPPSVPSTSNLPVAGLSPAQVINQSFGGDLKPESGCAGSLCVPVSPESSPGKQEPELIVLSDSSEEMMDVKQRVTETSPPSDVEHEMSPGPGELLNCSPELSWLIPSTPDQLDKNTTSSSTHTRRSICRTTLFPKADSSLSFSPALPRLTSKGSVSPSAQGSSSSKDAFNAFEAKKSHPSRVTHPPSLQETFHIKCYSSTPLHTELHLPHVPLLQDSVSDHQPSTSESPLNNEVQCFHLSPDSEPSATSSAHRSLNQSRNHDGEITEKDFTSRKAILGEVSSGCDTDSSFQQHFMDMDEPPIAFNDSWNLDVCSEANAEHFSLRLNNSESTSQQELSPGKQRRSSSSSRSAPSSSSSPSVHSVNRGKTLTSPGRIQHSHPQTTASVEMDEGLLDSKIWDSWEEDEEEEPLPLSQRVKPAAQIQKTPVLAQSKRRRMMVPITPMPHYSDMDTPELKNKLNRYGVRPLPKRQMVVKLKEIHQYTHQLTSSDSEDEEPSTECSAQVKPLLIRPILCATSNQFKEPRPPTASPGKHNTKVVEEEGEEPLSASQGSNTSSNAASEESERSNPELIMSSDRDSDSDGGVSASQSASRLQDRLLAVRGFILSHPELYGRILQYQPLVLSQLQEQLKAAGIRLGVAKLVDYLDSQCITFTTAKPGQPAAGRGRKTRTRGKTGTSAGASRKKAHFNR